MTAIGISILSALLALSGCSEDKKETTPAKEPIATPQEKGDAPEESTEDKKEIKELPAITGKTHRVNRMVEKGMEYETEMVFLGWSEDNRYYAFERHFPHEGGHECGYKSELQIVDAKTDKWAKRSHLVVENKMDEEEYECLYSGKKGVRKAFNRKKKKRLKKWKITEGNLTKPISFKSKGSRYSLTMPDGRNALMYFKSDKGDTEKLGYKLSWREPFEKKIERGKKRDCMNGYRLTKAFFSPDVSHVAFVIEKSECAYEGTLLNFMTNGSPTKG